MDIELLKKKAVLMKQNLNLHSFPVGVKFIFDEKNSVIKGEQLSGYRYCQALMMARHGKHVTIGAEGLACPAAASAFGFKPLPAGLKTGQGLIGFGITQKAEVGKNMFEGMPKLEQGKLKLLYLFPLETAEIVPDVVIIEDEVENLMWIVLAQVNSQNGKRIESETAVLQGICVDVTLVPYIRQKFNITLGCYGCRDATDIGPNEAAIGFPFKNFENISGYIEYLSEKAIPDSRRKNAYQILLKRTEETSRKI
jgi:uncharacterized protein (DUF169 family)